MTSLALLQLVSPALPVGAFSYSEGLEVLIQAGSIADEQAIQAWLEAELQRGAVRLEAAALRPLVEALVGWSTQADAAAKERLIDLDGWLLATREAAELRAQQLQAADPQQLWSSGVGAGMAQLAHAELYSRLFRS